ALAKRVLEALLEGRGIFPSLPPVGVDEERNHPRREGGALPKPRRLWRSPAQSAVEHSQRQALAGILGARPILEGLPGPHRKTFTFGRAFRNAATPVSVTFVAWSVTTRRFSSPLSPFSPSSVTPVQLRKRVFNLLRLARAFNPESVTFV